MHRRTVSFSTVAILESQRRDQSLEIDSLLDWV